ncbi:Heterokaryon incompatibility protein 6, OR allele [Colletotrichum sidae]|uniref:Heterokaryon incompatibility protein 6, OR allele n=1 Tax=Colletotrichum sidae TaxID=1347389 RepID=A0A4R8TM58_9PEZI|nr:Heterokaryon incompatibility protein 6, OR allele [Colletotrichum sidae]
MSSADSSPTGGDGSLPPWSAALGITLIVGLSIARHMLCGGADRDFSSLAGRKRPLPRYAHAPLAEGSFRLLHLLPGRGDEQISVRLTAAPVTDDVEYHAVSYAWGDAGDTAYIRCDGCELPVARTLAEALRRWRRADETRVLWADSVCIDQRNTREKTRQIARMTDIYSRAAAVLVWLGGDDADVGGVAELVAEALDLIPPVVDDPRENRESAEVLGRRNARRFAEGRATTKSMEWKPLRALLRSPWFERKWVYQEAVLNSRTLVYCGRFELDFEPLAELALRLATFGIQILPDDGTLSDANVGFIPGRLYNLSIMRLSHWYRGKKPVSLMDGVKATRGFLCSNPRDHILGILGHASDVERDSIIAKDDMYEVSVRECFLRFTRSQLLEKGNLAVLASAPQRVVSDAVAAWYRRPYVRWTKRRLSGLPSWVPDLRNQEVDPLPSYTVRYGKFSSGGTEPGKIEIVDDRFLTCSGLVIDTLSENGIFWPDLPLPRKPKRVPSPLERLDDYHARNAWRALSFYRQCVKLACGSSSIHDMSADRLDAFWKTMTCERSQLSDRIDADMSGHLKSMVSGLEAWLTSDDAQEAERARARFVVSGQAVEMSVLAAATPRRFSATAEGRLCMVPREARKGDVVCLLLGSEVPFVIRPFTEGTYTLIGDAYVSGVMDGEALTSGRYSQVDITLE